MSEHTIDFKRDDRLLRKKILQFLIPCILYSAAMELGNICDNFLAGSFLGVSAIAAIHLGMNIDALTELPGIILASGGNAMASILLGKRKKDESSQVFSLTLLLGILFGIFFICLSPLAGFISAWMTGGNELTRDVTIFVRYTLLGAPVFCIGLQLASYAMMDNNPKLSSAYIVFSNLVKLASEYLLLRFTQGGTACIALSTYIGYGSGLLVFIPYFRSKERMLSLVNPCKNFIAKLRELQDYVKPFLVQQICDITAAFILSIFLLRFGGSISVTFLAITSTINNSIMWFVAGGFIKTVPAMIGVLYGQQDYFGLKSLIRHILRMSSAIIGLIILLLCIFSTQFLELFGFTADQLESTHYIIVAIASLEMMLDLLYTVALRYYQSIKQNKAALILTTVQGFFILLPLQIGLAFLARYLEIDIYYGILAAQGLSTIAALLITAGYIRIKQGKRNFWLLPANENAAIYDVTIDCSHTPIDQIPQRIMSFCIDNHIDTHLANLAAVTSEEIVVTILDINRGHEVLIDMNLKCSPENIILSIRSDGAIYNPASYIPTTNDFSSLALLNKLADKVQYMRALNFNYTVFTFKRKNTAAPKEN